MIDLRFISQRLHVRLAASLACGCWLAIVASPSLVHAQAAASPNKTTASSGSESQDEGKVLRHAVFFQFKDSASEEDVSRVVDAFAALPAKIDAIAEYQAGENDSPLGLDDGLTHCFLITFKDEAGRAAYLPHEDHKAFGGLLRPHLEKVFVIDYWAEPQTNSKGGDLKHMAFLKFREDVTDAEVQAMEESFATLAAKIDSVKSFEWGRNNSPEKHDEGFTHCFALSFDSAAGLADYLTHPEHQAFVAELRPVVEKVRVLDFSADGSEPKNTK
jgi:hypothetical protein